MGVMVVIGGIGGLLEVQIAARQAAALLAVALAAAGFLAAAPVAVGKTRICVYNSNHA
ncbi:MAG: hypothetical protein ACFNS6_01125 [Candidatus Saccharimonas sp.]